MKKKNILIVSPSLDPKENISGISSIVSLLVDYNEEVHYIPFVQGKKDKESRGTRWLLNQILTPFRLLMLLFHTHIDIIHFNIGLEPLSLIRDFGIYWLLKKMSYPILLHIHGGRYLVSSPSNRILKYIICYLLKHANHIVVLGNLEKESLSGLYQVDINSFQILSNAVAPSQMNISEKQYNSVLSILYLGRVDKNKGLKEILSVLNILMHKGINFNFYLCGVGQDKDWFIAECFNVIGNRLIDKGLIYGEEKLTILKISHLFILPSYFEGLPMALLESMNNYVVPIVTPVGSIPHVVRQGENGYLVSSISDMVDAIVNLDKNREILFNLAKSAKETINSSYSLDNYLRKLNKCYCSIIKEKTNGYER